MARLLLRHTAEQVRDKATWLRAHADELDECAPALDRIASLPWAACATDAHQMGRLLPELGSYPDSFRIKLLKQFRSEAVRW